jgi:histidinol phosphatase-like PHP family hydrolase
MPAIQYDYHIHSSFSDGNTSIRNIVERAIKLRLETIAIIDHFWPSIGSTRGGINLIKERREAIETVRGEYPQIRILEGAEVDINSDGTMAPVAGGLDQFDIVIGSIHWGSDSRLFGHQQFQVQLTERDSKFWVIGMAICHPIDRNMGTWLLRLWHETR